MVPMTTSAPATPLILPASAGLPGHPNLLVAAGKEGKIYLIDRDDMGHFDPNNDNVLNAVPDGSGQNTPPVQLSGSLSTPAWFNGTIYWTSGYSSYAYAFTIASNGTLVESSQTYGDLRLSPRFRGYFGKWRYRRNCMGHGPQRESHPCL